MTLIVEMTPTYSVVFEVGKKNHPCDSMNPVHVALIDNEGGVHYECDWLWSDRYFAKKHDLTGLFDDGYDLVVSWAKFMHNKR